MQLKKMILDSKGFVGTQIQPRIDAVSRTRPTSLTQTALLLSFLPYCSPYCAFPTQLTALTPKPTPLTHTRRSHSCATTSSDVILTPGTHRASHHLLPRVQSYIFTQTEFCFIPQRFALTLQGRIHAHHLLRATRIINSIILLALYH